MDTTKSAVTAAYVENGTVVILGALLKGCTDYLNAFTITDPKYFPRYIVYGIAQTSSTAQDFGKVNLCKLDKNGLCGFWLKDTLVSSVHFFITYPMKRD